MSKRNKKQLLIGLVMAITLSLLAYYFTTNKKTNTLSPNSNFAIKEVDKIDKLIISDNHKNRIELIKKGNEWFLSTGEKARIESINLIKQAIQNIDIQSNIPQTAQENVLKGIASYHTKVEIFLGENKAEKTYYIGSRSQDGLGTYMLLKDKNGNKSSIAYSMHIPGFHGNLATRFFVVKEDWIFTGIFNYKENDIKQINVEFGNNEELEGFSIDIDKEQKLSLFNKNKNDIQDFNKNKVRKFINHFQKVHYLRRPSHQKDLYRMDSILNTNPYCTITVTDNNGDKKWVKTYKKLFKPGTTNIYTNSTIKFDSDNMYGITSSNDTVLLQYYVFDKLMLPMDYYLNQNGNNSPK